MVYCKIGSKKNIEQYSSQSFEVFSKFISTGAFFSYSACTRSMTVTSGGDKKRIGGPHVPEPLLT
jgi:hypothetical protein